MAWPADQNNIYYSGYYSAPPLPQLLDFSWELDLPVDSMRHWESYCLSCHRPMLASSPDPQSVVPGPNPTRSVPASGNVHSQTPQTSDHSAGQGASLQCKWEGCGKSIKQKNDLMRHIRECHVAPNAFRCPVENCTHAASRKYNLQKHMENHHRY